jgi:hypothetical protein
MNAAFAAFTYDFGQPVSNALFAPRQSQKIVLETSFSLTNRRSFASID